LWTRSISYHYFFGVISVGASVISTSLDGTPAKIFSIVAAIATAMIGFIHPERRYLKFVAAWRVLDVAAMRYRHGLSEKSELIAAVEQGHTVIANFEEQVKPDALAAELGRQSSAEKARAADAEPAAGEPAQPPAQGEPPTADTAADLASTGEAAGSAEAASQPLQRP
jgi:hypothetical protein